MRTAQWKTWGEPPSEVAMSAWQDGRCAWCGYGKTALVRDHCHLTGLIRGLLCHSCNQHEGVSFSEDWEPWRSGDNIAAAIGHFEIYRDHMGITPINPQSALSFYTYSEQQEWFAQAIVDLKAGSPWPAEAPWTDVATARREDVFARARVALDRGGRWSA